MESLKVDKTKLKKFSTYAKEYGFSPQRIYQLAKENKVKVVIIDGVKFVEIP